jgi:hypothetical protein
MTPRFEKLAGESAKAYAAWRTYLEMGPERSLTKLAKAIGKKPRLMEYWSKKWDWQGRLESYQEHCQALERRAIEAVAMEKGVEWGRIHEAIRMAEWQRHRRLIALADEVLARWERCPGKMGTLEGVARLYELASKLARLAAGMPSEVKEINTTVTGKIDMDWEVAIRKAYHAEVIDVESSRGGTENAELADRKGQDRQ